MSWKPTRQNKKLAVQSMSTKSEALFKKYIYFNYCYEVIYNLWEVA